jgi:hypothetical protein
MDLIDAVDKYFDSMTDEQRQAYLEMWRAETRLPPWMRALSTEQDVKRTIQ